MAFPYSSQEELALPRASQRLVKLEAGSSDVSISSSQKPCKEAPKPNKARRAFRHTQLAANQFLQRRRRATGPRNERLPLSAIELILQTLDIRGAAREDKQNATDRPPVRPCPPSANELYDRLELSRSVVRCVLGRGTTARPARYVTSEELPRLIAPVLADMRACLGYVAAFRSLLDLETEGSDQWLDLSHLRQCVSSHGLLAPRYFTRPRGLELWAA
ncbi:hypothetical protein Daus18300_004354 [Diaporthe australafricana]|uniref:Uncharacterized protein n=1 Tax=Diaporthe australafricana TaxID=127596 RepID=A0ABR3X9T3_9PEZI